VALHPETEWHLYADAEGAETIDLPGAASVHVVRQGAPPTEALGTGSSRRPLDVFRLSRAVGRRDLDVFLAPSVYSWFPVLGVPSVVGLHDANAMTHPRHVLPSARDRAMWRIKQALAVRRAARLFTVSEAARNAISEHLALPRETIAVVPEAPDPAFAPQPADAVDAACEELGLSRGEGYFVFGAGISPHKGLDTLVDAYSMLRARGDGVPPLVIVGSLAGPYANAAEAVTRRIARPELHGAVRLPGFVSDRTLASLYTGASAAVAPSLGEGFGLSAVEAAACGAPVVASDIGPHRETLGDAGAFFPPGDARTLRDRLAHLLDAPEDRRALGERARAAASRFTWDETARRLHALLAEAAAI
jgi:glycosyltransferase involved in cell wall biosynthesis